MSAILRCESLSRNFGGQKRFWGPRKPLIQAVNDISLEIQRGETLGIVGESGCGKSTLGRLLAGLDTPSSGQLLFRDQPLGTLLQKDSRQLRQQIQFVFQDTLSSLNPRKTIRQILEAPLIHLLNKSRTEREERLRFLMEAVRLRPEFLDRYPHEFSGGQSQRIGIARALAAEPELIILDEPVSALDVSVQAQILNLLQELKTRFQLTYIFISHDLAVVEKVCDRVAVMYLGKQMELARRETLFRHPRHPYTETLLASIPGGRSSLAATPDLPGELPDPANPPSGCVFHTRCPRAEQKCTQSRPPLEMDRDAKAQAHQFACYFPTRSP